MTLGQSYLAQNALNEASRSIERRAERRAERQNLEVWNGTQYVAA